MTYPTAVTKHGYVGVTVEHGKDKVRHGAGHERHVRRHDDHDIAARQRQGGRHRAQRPAAGRRLHGPAGLHGYGHRPARTHHDNLGSSGAAGQHALERGRSVGERQGGLVGAPEPPRAAAREHDQVVAPAMRALVASPVRPIRAVSPGSFAPH